MGTTQQRTQFTLTGKQPEGTRTVPLLGDRKVHDLTTSDIRSWHKTLGRDRGDGRGICGALLNVNVLATLSLLSAAKLQPLRPTQGIRSR
jgi:hypothetical protein